MMQTALLVNGHGSSGTSAIVKPKTKESFYKEKKDEEAIVIDMERRNEEKLLELQEIHQKELNNKLTAVKLVHRAQLHALTKHLLAQSQSILHEKMEQKEKEMDNLLDSNLSTLLKRVCNLEIKLQELTHSRQSCLEEENMGTAERVNELEMMCKKLEDELERKEIEFNKYKEELENDTEFSSVQQQINELKDLHMEVIKEMEEKFAAEQIERENEIEKAVCQELSRANEVIEERLSELENVYLNRERKILEQLNQLNTELDQRGEAERYWIKECEDLKLAMASLEKEQEIMIDKSAKEKEKLISKHQRELTEVKRELVSQIENTVQISEQLKMKDTVKLELLQQELQKIEQERNSLHNALMSLYHSVVSLIPAAKHNGGVPNLATPIATDWTSPLPAQSMATPTSPAQKIAKVVNTGDSGLDSRQVSGSKAPPTNYNGSILETTPTLVHKPNLSISYLHDEEDDPNQLGTDNLTIYSLNSTLTEDSYDITTQEMISHLFQSVSTLIDSFLKSTQKGDNNKVDELMESQSDLNKQLHKVEQLQNELQELQKELLCHRGKEDELVKAQEKIASLISEIEALQKSYEDNNELVTESEELLKDYRQLDISYNELQAQFKEQQVVIETLNQEKVTQQNNSTKQIESLEKKLHLLQSEYTALQSVVHESQRKLEITQEQHRQEVEYFKSECNSLATQLKKSTNQINELEDFPAQLLIKEKKEEELQATIKDLSDQLTAALHQVAINESIPDLRKQLETHQQQLNEYREKYDGLLKIYEEGVASLTSAKGTIDKSKEMEETLQVALRCRDDEMKKKEEEMLKLMELKETMERDCEDLNDQITTLSNNVDVLTEQLKVSNEQVSQLCHQLEERDNSLEELSQQQLVREEEIQQLQKESATHLQAYEGSIVEVQHLEDEVKKLKKCLIERENDIKTLTISKGEVMDQLTHLKSEATNKQEYHQLQILSLQNSLEQVKSELSVKQEKENEIDKLKAFHEQELKELEERLQVEYAGQESLLRVQLKELSETHLKNNEQLLEQIATLTPKMESDAHEVLHLCKEQKESLGAYISKLQQKSSETIKSLTDVNTSLERESAVAKETLAQLEQSMKLANETLSSLQNELQESTKREKDLQDKLSQQMNESNVQLSKVKQHYEQILSSERENKMSELQRLEKEKQELSDRHEKLLRQLKAEKDSHVNLQTVYRELVAAHKEAEESNVALEENIKTVQSLLEDLKKCNDRNVELTDLLEKEKHHVASLQQMLENKESELSQAIEQYLAEKLNVAQLRGENIGLVTRLQKASDKESVTTLQAKCRHLKEALRVSERKRKSLVFQKCYLKSEITAYYHTHQAALLMIQDMGGLPWQPFPHCNAPPPKRKFKIFAIAVVASIKLRKLYYRRTQNTKH